MKSQAEKLLDKKKKFADVIDVDADDETYARTPLVLVFWLV